MENEEMEEEESGCSDPIAQEPMLDGVIHYLNTDLDLRSAEDLTPLPRSSNRTGCGKTI